MAAQVEREFDLVIVGASFAGAACAIAAAQYGLRVRMAMRLSSYGPCSKQTANMGDSG